MKELIVSDSFRHGGRFYPAHEKAQEIPAETATFALKHGFGKEKGVKDAPQNKAKEAPKNK